MSPDVIVVSGDMTQRAKPEQFRAAREFLDELPDVPRIEVPGNHDVPLYRAWERLMDPHRHYKAEIHSELNRVLEVEGALLVGLDTTAPHRTITRGKIDRDQIQLCREAMARAPEGAAKVVVVHHQFVSAHDSLRDRSMIGAEWAMAQLIDMGVDLILGGHLHRSYIGNSLDFFFKGPRDRGIILVQSGTTTSRRGRGRERERNSMNIIDIHPAHLEVTHLLYLEETDDFSAVSVHLFPRHGHLLQGAPRSRKTE